MPTALLLLCALVVASFQSPKPQAPSPLFEPIQPELFAAGATFVNAFADVDGDADLLVGFTPSPNASVLKVYRNDAGTFVDVAESAGVAWGGRAPKHAGHGIVRV